jgi:hypothetical protein
MPMLSPMTFLVPVMHMGMYSSWGNAQQLVVVYATRA